ncbi:phosphoenolpyruvate--protein phosphotransferase [Sanguibacter sp. Leaf3]|uniref:phosphoenolpyruvate--protein phosphotransferase n=1 Tax=Sanguibacter sp. Leaf3 TaxID=1736209 RepID=UPI0006F230D5|nr:phosphoenolpyruvate--protein phosphotransferase [Sanguibacter sp. Leaf3]KQT96706.1 phosphoenolpyruvate-protein phosphotransferase [Sanguibacter sp. Leaf3]
MTSTLHGAGVSPGLRSGAVATMPPPVPEPTRTTLGPGTAADDAAASITEAVHAVQADLSARAARATGTAVEVLTMTAAMAADPTLLKEAARKVREELTVPARAVWEAADDLARRLESLGGVMAERADDVRDVRERIVAALTGQQPPGVPDLEQPFVLVAADLAPADTATLDPARVLAIVTSGGGPTSHTAILARSLGIPAVVAVRGALDLVDGEVVLVDGREGTVERTPSAEAVARAQSGSHVERSFDGRGRTADGVRVQLLANVADPAAAAAAVAAGAEGVGLFRTEFCFLGRTDEPGVAEQVTAYRAVLAAFPGRKVVVRTLDAGADKPLPYVTADDEPNPALGVRGLRTAVRHPGVLGRQLDAIARASAAEDAEVWVMAPMVATPDEARDFAAACRERGLATSGVMIEVPAAALQSRWVLAQVDFASIGTNDLTQYAMAADREAADLAALSTPWQPAVLSLVGSACAGGAEHGRPVGVCGEAASDPSLAPVLVGLGVTSLSMAPRALGDVAAVLAATSSDLCTELAQIAVASPTAAAARAAVRARLPVLEELGL